EKSLTPAKSAALPENNKNNNDLSVAVTHLRGDDVIAVGLRRSSVAFYNAQSGEEVAKFSLPIPQTDFHVAAYQVATSLDGGLLLINGRAQTAFNDLIKPGNITLWDMTTGERAWTFTHEKLHAGQAALSPDGRYIAVGFLNDPVVRLYSLADK